MGNGVDGYAYLSQVGDCHQGGLVEWRLPSRLAGNDKIVETSKFDKTSGMSGIDVFKVVQAQCLPLTSV